MLSNTLKTTCLHERTLLRSSCAKYAILTWKKTWEKRFVRNEKSVEGGAEGAGVGPEPCNWCRRWCWDCLTMGLFVYASDYHTYPWEKSNISDGELVFNKILVAFQMVVQNCIDTVGFLNERVNMVVKRCVFISSTTPAHKNAPITLYFYLRIWNNHACAVYVWGKGGEVTVQRWTQHPHHTHLLCLNLFCHYDYNNDYDDACRMLTYVCVSLNSALDLLRVVMHEPIDLSLWGSQSRNLVGHPLIYKGLS